MGDQKEQTYIMVKPDGVQRGLVSHVIKRFQRKGYQLIALKMVQPTQQLLQQHYSDLSSKPFFKDLVSYMASGPVVCMVWRGLDVVKQGRVLLGETRPLDSKPGLELNRSGSETKGLGTLRGDFCIDVGRNLVHGSDSVESAKKEIALWFKQEEMCEYTPADISWIYG
ncbi:hypothetical protein ACSSS7_007111 [Eimeria intestinalis]